MINEYVLMPVLAAHVSASMVIGRNDLLSPFTHEANSATVSPLKEMRCKCICKKHSKGVFLRLWLWLPLSIWLIWGQRRMKAWRDARVPLHPPAVNKTKAAISAPSTNPCAVPLHRVKRSDLNAVITLICQVMQNLFLQENINKSKLSWWTFHLWIAFHLSDVLLRFPWGHIDHTALWMRMWRVEGAVWILLC